MSKSAPDVSSRILLTDTNKDIARKIRTAVTDSIPGVTYDPETRPGTSNLLAILAACTQEDAATVAQRYEGKGHGHLKSDVAEAVTALLRGPRAEFERLRGDKAYLDKVAREGGEKARSRSRVTMLQVKKAVGLA